jgi:hypothetical protein
VSVSFAVPVDNPGVESGSQRACSCPVSALGVVEGYYHALEHLRVRAAQRTFLGELTLRDVLRHRDQLLPALAEDVRSGRYAWSDARKVTVRIENKDRVLFQTSVLDAVVERALGRWLAERADALCSPNVYSYRRGVGPGTAWKAFRAYILAYRSATPSVRERGLYVLRRDVRAYGESIPVDDGSPLWARLDAVMGADPDRERAQLLLRALLQRSWFDANGETGVLSVGTPTGSSVQPVVNNLYLDAVDRVGASLGFYSRFGDDILFATADPECAGEAARRLEAEVARLYLEFGAAKSRDLFFNGAARPGPVQGWEPVDSVEYLGAAIRFNGNITAKGVKWSHLLGVLDHRLRRARHQAGSMAPERLSALLCRVAHDALEEAHPAFGGEAQSLLQQVDDRSQLRSFDYWLCKRVAELSSGKRGVRAFRDFPPNRLFALGLPSLVARRNQR